MCMLYVLPLVHGKLISELTIPATNLLISKKATLLISLLLVQSVRALAWLEVVSINCTQSEKFDGSQSYKCCLCVVFKQVALLFFTASLDRGFSHGSTCQLLVHLAGF